MQHHRLMCPRDELQKDKVSVRLKAIALLGRLFVHPSRQFAQEYPTVFAEFLKRFSDKVVEVRVAVVNCSKAFVEAYPTSEQAVEILSEFLMFLYSSCCHISDPLPVGTSTICEQLQKRIAQLLSSFLLCYQVLLSLNIVILCAMSEQYFVKHQDF